MSTPVPLAPRLSIAGLILLLSLGACAEGGSEDRTSGDVQLSATHNMVGLRALGAFTQYPLLAAEVFPDQGLFTTFDDETYTVTRSSGTSPANAYALADSGELAVLVQSGGRDPNVVFRGAYGLAGATNLFFFVDRTVTTASPSVGMFVGARTVPGEADLEGSWHVASLHLIFASTQVQDPDNVARTAFGTLDVAAGTPGTALAVTGTGTESTSATLTFTGTLAALMDGEANLTLGYGGSNLAADRTFLGVTNDNALLAVDADVTDDASGLLLGVRARTGPIDPAALAGNYFIGGMTAFVNPRNAGTDGAYGNLELTTAGSFRIEMVGAQGADFTYQGTWEALTGPGQNGLFELTVSGTNEVWRGAVDQGYSTVVIGDTTVELRSNDTPELNLFLALRKVAGS